MVNVVHAPGGTANRIGTDARYRIAGKTGTAQVFSLRQNQKYSEKSVEKHLRDHALFIAFAPADDPRIAVAVLVENGGGGSRTAAPVARKVMDHYLLGGSSGAGEGEDTGDDGDDGD
jgi:penicillin-binding protein 2